MYCGSQYIGPCQREEEYGVAYVVPVSLSLLQGCALELEASQPSAALFGVFGKRKLTLVVVPRAEEVNRFAVARRAEREIKLNGCHCEVFFCSDSFRGRLD